MANAPQMKIPIGADTQDFEKGAKKVKQEMRDLDKVSSDAFSAIGNALGVDTGKLQQFSSAVQGLGTKFTQMGSSGAQAFGNVLKSIAPVAAGIAGLGIAGATAAFKALNSEAEAFRNTVAGANMEMATAQYINTYRQAISDMNSEVGRSVAETQSSWQKFWGTLGANMKAYVASGAYWDEMWGRGGGESLKEYQQAIGVATEKAGEAERITNEIFRLERQRSDNMVKIAELTSQISEEQLKAREALSAGDAATGFAAIAAARDLINQKAELQVPIEAELARLMQERNDLVSSSVKDVDAANQQAVAAYNAEKERTDQLRTLMRLQNSLNSLASQDAVARNAAAAAAREEAAAMESLRSVMAAQSEIETLSPDPLGQAEVQVPVGLVLPEEEVHRFKEHIVAELGGGVTLAIAIDPESVDEVLDITKEVEQAIASTATIIGESIGGLMADLLTGNAPWKNFANSAIQAFGDMAVTVGKTAISVGTTVLGIKAALKSLNGYVAIAAGVALVALGTAVKGALSNVASGNYSASSNVASSSYSSSLSNDYSERQMNVHVTGTLTAQGSQLVAVLNNEGQRTSHTT